MSQTNLDALKASVSGAYQLQKLRIQIGNRIVAYLKHKVGQQDGMSEEELEKEAQNFLQQLRKDYNSITEGALNYPSLKQFKPCGYIDQYSELSLVEQYVNMEKAEDDAFKRMAKEVQEYPLWREWLVDVKGIGPAMAAVLLTRIDIHKATYRSSLEKFAGIDVAQDGAGRSKRKEHLVNNEYTSKTGSKKTRKSITFQPFLKTKLMGVLAGSFLKCKNEKYSGIYYDYKNRYENHIYHRDNFAAIDVEGCKEKLGFIPAKIYYDGYVESVRSRLTNHDFIADKEVQRALITRLGNFVTINQLEELGLIIGPNSNSDLLELQVKEIGGVLRKPVEKEIFYEETDDEGFDYFEIKTIEEFDESLDKKGRKLYKRVNIGKSKNHRHAMALRKMMKFFLHDLYEVWRKLENLEVYDSYETAKLGIVHKAGSNY